MLLAAAQEAAGQQDDAIETLEITLEENPDFFRGYVRLAELYERQRRFQRRRRCLRARRRPRNSRASTWRARRAAALINAGKPAEARDAPAGRDRKKTAPDAGLAVHAGAVAAAAEGLRRRRRDGAEAEVRVSRPTRAARISRRSSSTIAGARTRRSPHSPNSIKRSPEDAIAGATNTRTCSRRAGRVADAERALRDLLAKDPLDANALNSLGYLLADHGQRLDEAVDLVQRALKVEPGNPSFLDSLGWAYFQQGKLDLRRPAADRSGAKAADELGDPGSPRRSALQAAAVCRRGRRRGSGRSPATASRSIAPRSRRRCATRGRASSK